MDDAASLLVRHLARREAKALRVLDVACSSGVSTVELHDALQGAGFECETYGSDIVTAVSLVKDATGRALLFDGSRRVLRVDWRGASLPWPPMRSDFLFRPLQVAQAAWCLSMGVRDARRALNGVSAGYTVTPVPLTTAAAQGVSGLSLVQEGIEQPRIAGAFDVVRAANILNRDYFDTADLRRMIRAVLGRVTAGGLLLVLRSGKDLVNRGTLFRCGREIAVVERLNGGSEVEPLVIAAGG